MNDHCFKSSFGDQPSLHFIGNGMSLCNREQLIDYDRQLRMSMRAEASARTNIPHVPDSLQIIYKPDDAPGVDRASIHKHRNRSSKHPKPAETDESGNGDGKPGIGIFPTSGDQTESA